MCCPHTPSIRRQDKELLTKKRWITALAVLAAAGIGAITVACSDNGSVTNTNVATGKVKHVWVITLENENYSTTFGAGTKSPYLAKTLTAQGALLSGYYGTGHVSLDNYVSMLSGQPGTPQTVSDCITYADFKQMNTTFQDQLPVGSGCVYPASVKTLPDQLTAKGLTWKGYMGDMGNDPARESATCGHPALNTTDLTQTAEAPSAAVPLGDQYATRHNPFMYFHSIIDSPSCQSNVVNLDKNLANDLASASTTANFNFITPSLCDDGHDAPCVDGRPGGLVSADAFLQKWIPIITASPAYQADGLIIINFDESSYGSFAASASGVTVTFNGGICCGQLPGPNLAAYPQTTSLKSGSSSYTLTYTNYGGDNTGAVLLSPFIKPGTVTTTGYNHYSMLRSIEDIFGLDHIGYAQESAVGTFGTDIFTGM
jgi:phosphatidylinositol-3-phosphatase